MPKSRSTPSRTQTPLRSPTPQKYEPSKSRSTREPVVEKASRAVARGSSPDPRRTPPPKQTSDKEKPQRKKSIEQEIDRLDKIVDRDLNDIISTIGKKSGQPSGKEKDAENNLKQKIFNPSFQAEMDTFLRDI